MSELSRTENEVTEKTPDIIFYIKKVGSSMPLTMSHFSSRLKRSTLIPTSKKTALELAQNEEAFIEIRLKGNAFLIKSSGIRNCKVNDISKPCGFAVMIWPDQIKEIQIDNIDYQFYVRNCMH